MEIINRVINNVNVTFIKTKKFKSIAGVLCFESFATRKKMTTRTFLRNMLVYNTKKFPTNEDLNTNCLENFDASFGANSYRTGDIYTNSFYFKTLEDEYTEEGNLENVIDTFCEIIFNPNIKNEEFDKKSFDNRKKKLREFYERIKENQRDYAEHRIIKFLNQNKEYSYQFELEELEKITPSSLYEEYKEMIEQSKVNLLLVGNIDENDKVYEKITSKVKNNVNHNFKLYINNDDEEKKEDIIETSTGTQAVLHVLYYLKNMTDYEINYVMPIYKMIFGGAGSSRLFNELREKNSLAYYCFARLEKDDNTLEVIAGIEEKNYDKAIKIIDGEFNKMNVVSEEEIECAKKELISSLLESQDNILNVISRKKVEQVYNLPDCDGYIKQLESVSKEEVENIHKKIQLGFRYFLKGSDNNG